MEKGLIFTPFTTRIFQFGENLAEFIISQVPSDAWKENLILAVTSKLVSLSEKRTVTSSSFEKAELISREADYLIGEMRYGTVLTIKHGLLLASAGIDESNSQNGDYILLPENPFSSAENLRQKLLFALGLKNLGVVITDSKSGPLRWGVSGVSIGVAGFDPVSNQIGNKDLFGRPLTMTRVNIADSLAAAAVLTMGEANESQPLALIENARVQFKDSVSKEELFALPKDDMYLPLYQHFLK